MITSKQRAYLRSLANPIDTILIVGKGGMSDDIITQANDALNKREIIKGKVLRETSPIDAKSAANEIAQKTNSEVIQVIGYKFVLYKKNKDKPVIKLPK